MIFTTRSKIMSAELQSRNTSAFPTQPSNAMMMRAPRVFPPKSIPTEPVVQTPPNPSKKTMKWGGPTWVFFHTLAEKIKPEEFGKVRVELLNIISNICRTLPCPDCANHAKKYIAGINFNAIQSKEDLKNMFYVFHNTVNQRKGIALYDRSNLESIYSQKSFIPVVNEFLYHYRDRHRSLKLMADDLSRNHYSNFIQSWFTQNLNSFAA